MRGSALHGTQRHAGSTASNVADTNSTLHHFAGQRQLEWMQPGYIAPSLPEQDGHAGVTDHTPVSNTHSHRPPHLGDHAADTSSLPDAAGALIQLSTAAGGSAFPTTLASSASARAPSTGVLSTAAHLPFLPSPVATEHTASPNTGWPSPSMAPTSQNLALAGPSHPHGHPHHVTPSMSPTIPRVPSQCMPPPPRPTSSTPSAHNGQPPGAVRYGEANSTGSTNHPHETPPHMFVTQPAFSVNQHTLRNGVIPASDPSTVDHAFHARWPYPARRASQPSPVLPPPSTEPSIREALSKSSMTQRLNEFHLGHATAVTLSDIDYGRLLLLQHAVEQYDMFTIVLSQFHALQTTPQLLPQSARKLDRRCFQYLDKMLAANTAVSPPVLAWLSEFPAPIQVIYFSPPAAGLYEAQVNRVVDFLSHLPAGWDLLEDQCRQRGAPPLVQDLDHILSLPRSILQTAAFRAMARTVLKINDQGREDFAVNILEHLHREDQHAFLGGEQRKGQPMGRRRDTLVQTVSALQEYDKAVARHQRDPLLSKQPPLQFVLPPLAAAALGLRPVIDTPQLAPQGPLAEQSVLRQSIPPFQHTQVFSRNAHDIPVASAATQAADTPAQNVIFQSPLTQYAAHQQPSESPRQRDKTVPLLPRHGDAARPQPTQPSPTRSALHQAHLRSPTLTSPATTTTGHNESLLYRYVIGFATRPAALDKNLPIQYIKFNITQEFFDKIPKDDVLQTPGAMATRFLTPNSIEYRLRCATSSGSGISTEASWMVADNHWPDSLYLELNGEMLEPRRKLHHNRYLPIDLSPKIKCGQNEIKLIINRTSDDPRPFRYALGVELVGVMTKATLMKGLIRVSAERSLATMKASMLQTSDDDDVSITPSSLTIQLFDPHSKAKIFDLPVRGVACQHKDCFDLETFLALRKREPPGGPTVVDCWRCPICRGDVRPHKLVVDEFLVDVRKQLEQKGMLDTRAIAVEADGSWHSKEEVLLGVRSPSLEREERSDSSTTGREQQPREVIEID